MSQAGLLMHLIKDVQESKARIGLDTRLLQSALNMVIPGLGFLARKDFKAALLNFLGFVALVFIAPFVVGHENQSVVLWIYGAGLLVSGLICWGEER